MCIDARPGQKEKRRGWPGAESADTSEKALGQPQRQAGTTVPDPVSADLGPCCKRPSSSECCFRQGGLPSARTPQTTPESWAVTHQPRATHPSSEAAGHHPCAPCPPQAWYSRWARASSCRTRTLKLRLSKLVAQTPDTRGGGTHYVSNRGRGPRAKTVPPRAPQQPTSPCAGKGNDCSQPGQGDRSDSVRPRGQLCAGGSPNLFTCSGPAVSGARARRPQRLPFAIIPPENHRSTHLSH